MKKRLKTLFLFGAIALSHLAAGQDPAPRKPVACGTPALTKEYLAAHPDIKKRQEAMEAHTQRYIKAMGTEAQRAITPSALITIPVVVHIVYCAANQNLSDAVVQSQIDELNLAFRGALSPGPNGAPVPGAFAPFVGDARVQFCLAKFDPNGNPTTGITRRNNIGQYFWFDNNTVKWTGSGGTDAWNTANYLNIWVANMPHFYGHAVFPSMAVNPNEDGISMHYEAFGRGHAALDPSFAQARVAVHEVGHWLNLAHIWGDDGAQCYGSDMVDDTPNQGGLNIENPAFPHVSCGNGPDGDMFMNHMDYVDDDSKLLFTAKQALRMQATFAAGGYRASLKSSPALNPTLGITSLNPIPTTVFCGDQTPFRLRAGSGSVGCGGGSLQYQWTATNGWTIDNPTAYSPLITPSGTGAGTITLTGTYTNVSGVSFALNTTSIAVSFNAAAGRPVFTTAPGSPCLYTGYVAEVSAVAGATGYRWTVPPGFTPTGQITTTMPSLGIPPNPGLAGGFYSVVCQALSGSCAISASASVPLTVNGGPLLKIVDANPSQRTAQGIVCQRNRIFLQLVPVNPPPPGAINGTYTGIAWSTSMGTPGNQSTAFPLQISYATPDVPNFFFTATATYYDACNNFKTAVSYSATTAPAGSASLSNGYSCTPYRWRPTPMPPSVPYPNPAAGTLQLPGYRGTVVVYNQQGKPVHHLLSPGTPTGAILDTSTWPEGLYVVTGRNLQGEFQRHNIQIQH